MTIASGTCGESATYRLEDDGTLYIEGTGAMTDYTSKYDVPWHSKGTSILSVFIDGGITHIGDEAFEDCTNLVSVEMSGVQTIGSYSFQWCEGLVSVEMNNIETIGEYAFRYCGSLENIVFGANLTSIGKHAFLRERSILTRRTFKFFGSKPTFGDYAIGYTYYNTSKYKDENVVSLTTGFGYNSSTDNNMFYSKCYALKFGDNIDYTVDGDTLTLSGSGEAWTFEGNCAVPLDAISCTRVNIGQGITINSTTLTSLKSNLVSLSIHQTTIDASMFSDCSKLRNLDISGVETIGASAFSGHNCYSIIVPASVTSIGANAFTPATNAYRKHMTIVFRGARISGTYTAPTGMMIYEFCKNEAENDNSADYAAGTVNSSHPVMIRTAGGWRVISTDMIDNT